MTETFIPNPLKPYRFLLFAILLLPVIFLPMSNDLSIFMRGGETVLGGGKLYKDFVDLKPPLIYYITIIPQILFGPTEFSPRLFDFLWQLATALSLYFVVWRVLKDEAVATASAAVYCILYATLNSTQTFTCEGLSAIAFVWLIDLQLRKNGAFKRYFLMGMLIGWCVALKYTLGIVLVAVLLDDVFKNSFKNNFTGFLKKYMAIAAGMVLATALGLLPLFDRETFAAYQDVLSYVVYYTSITQVNAQFLRDALGSIAGFFGDTFSFFLTGAVVAVVHSFFKRNSDCKNKEENLCGLFGVCVMFIAILLFSVVLERRFASYYFSRMYIPLSILAGYGLLKIYRSIRSDWDLYHRIMKVLVISSVIFILPFSPLPRFISMVRMSVWYVSGSPQYQLMFEREGDNIQNYSQQKGIARILESKRKPGEKVFVMSIGASPIYNFLKEKNASRFAHSQFYFGNGVPQNWLEDARREVLKTTWLVVQLNDGHPILNGHTRDSYSSLKADPVLWPHVSQHFTLVDSTKEFYILKRTGPGGKEL